MDNKINIVNWNGRSILNKSSELFEFLLNRNIHIAVITETWLKKNNSLYHASFSCIRNDRQSDSERGGGVAIIIRKGIQFNVVDAPNLQVIETVGIQISSSAGNIDIVAAYFPGSSQTATLNKFKRDLRMLTNKTNPYFVIGDLNARNRYWNCLKNNKAGNILLDLSATGFSIHAPVDPTHIPANGGRPSVLDIIVTNNAVEMTFPQVSQDLSSDHFPVLFSIDAELSHQSPSICYRSYGRANWQRFQREVNNRIDLLSPRIAQMDSTDGIDNAVEFFANTVIEAERSSVPLVEHTPQPARLPEPILLLIRLRNRRRRQFLRTRDPFIGSIVTALNNQIRDECAANRFAKFGEVLEAFESSDKKFWKITRCLRNNVKYSPPLRRGNALIASPKEKAQTLAEGFAAAHMNNLPSDPATVLTVDSCYEQLSTNNDINSDASTFTKPREISDIIKSLSIRKSPGYDQVSNASLKHLPRKGLILLTKIFNSCTSQSYPPKSWKHAIVIAIPKPKKDSTNPSNYRPISLLSSISKLFERVLLNRINRFLEANPVIPNEQFGFKSGHSTNHQLVRLTQSVRSNIAQKKSVGLVLLDVEKAFDSVWHQALVYKMHQSEAPIYLTKLVKSFLENRTYQVRIQGQLSDTFGIPFGVPQGSTLSPVLYNLYISDVPQIDGVCYYFFADDTGFSAADLSADTICQALQSASDSLSDYQSKWRIKVNPAKTQVMFFTRRRHPRHLPRQEITISNQAIPWSDESIYLGLLLDSKMNFGKHINQVLLKCKRTVSCLYSLLNRRSRLDKKLKLLLYKAIIRPIMLYGYPAWQICAESHRKKLQVQQNKILKMVLDLDPFYRTAEVHRIAKIDTVNSFIELGMSKFRNRCRMSTNPLITALQ